MTKYVFYPHKDNETKVDIMDRRPNRRIVEAWIDGPQELVAVVDESGRYQCLIVNELSATTTDKRGPLPVNLHASPYYARISQLNGFAGDTPIHGNAILVSEDDEHLLSMHPKSRPNLEFPE